ncbi:MAG: 23S rRNA (uracil(1939)-C(5))-methyltransferase RlmD [Spirochaetaceae bacterium]|nr:23S rRNA (uracil(1939)-C(5))-methyltransferase RlmD [Spirochaetaceae bacterium]
MKENTAKIVDFGTDGEPIAKTSEGKVIFLPPGSPVAIDDTVEYKEISRSKNIIHGEIVTVTETGPNHGDVACPYFSQCGGCPLMANTYETQLRFKEKKVRDCLRRIASVDEKTLDEAFLPIVPSPKQFNYRNKVSFAIQGGKYGFFRPKSRDFTEVKNCMIAFPEVQKLLAELQSETDGNLVLRKSESRGEIMAFEDRTGERPKILSSNTILNEEISINETTLTFQFGPRDFFQVNSHLMPQLYKTALDFAQIEKDQTVIDLYCGIGTISLFAAKKAKTLLGIESFRDAQRSAKGNAKLNKIENARFFACDAQKLSSCLTQKDFDTVILDPPRKGASRRVLGQIVGAKRIVYVSCDPATLARDIIFLKEKGFEVKKIRCFDMFPQTIHVETVCLLEK